MRLKPKVSLFPWDAKSAIHRRQLYEQRVECNWDREKVEKEWREQQARGEKCMYWIVSLVKLSNFLCLCDKGVNC